MKLDVLVFTAHPDDAEFAMGGTILKFLSQGKTVGIVDFTQGELGTRGSAELRLKEAAEADRRMGLTVRVNLGFRDGFFTHDEAHVKKVIQTIRRFQPDIVFANAEDRHPDHLRAQQIVRDAMFLSGLPKIETVDEGKAQNAWRPKRLYHYIQSTEHKPDFVVDITPFWEQKQQALAAYESQFHFGLHKSDDPKTILCTKEFWSYMEARARTVGFLLGITFGEGFTSAAPLRVEDLGNLAL